MASSQKPTSKLQKLKITKQQKTYNNETKRQLNSAQDRQ